MQTKLAFIPRMMVFYLVMGLLLGRISPVYAKFSVLDPDAQPKPDLWEPVYLAQADMTDTQASGEPAEGEALSAQCAAFPKEYRCRSG